MSGIVNNVSPFGKDVKSTLMDLNRTQAWLSEQTKIDQSTLSLMIRGERVFPDKEEAVKEFLQKHQREQRSMPTSTA